MSQVGTRVGWVLLLHLRLHTPTATLLGVWQDTNMQDSHGRQQGVGCDLSDVCIVYLTDKSRPKDETASYTPLTNAAGKEMQNDRKIR